MKHSTLTLTLTGLLAFCLAVPAAFADASSAVALAKSEDSAKVEPPAATPAGKPAGPLLGASDFLPTPEMPVGFRPNNVWYPGAGRPPLEFWDGTPGEAPVSGAFGNPPRRGTQKVWDCTDTKPESILWKAPAPGWGLTHPIVVGKKLLIQTSALLYCIGEKVHGKVEQIREQCNNYVSSVRVVDDAGTGRAEPPAGAGQGVSMSG